MNWLLAGSLLFVVLGCGDGGSSQQRCETMSKSAGVVTYKGKPVDTGTVSFSNPITGFSASGEIVFRPQHGQGRLEP